MKLTILLVQLAFGVGLFLCAIIPVYPHGGGLDAYGCHNNRKAGGYHCHRGPLAGRSFNSKEEMLKQLSAGKSPERTKSADKK